MNAIPEENRYVRARDHRCVKLSKIRPSDDNQRIYNRPPADRIRELADSIQKNGLLEPIVMTKDCVIVSGHTRFEACKLLGHETIDAYRLKGKRSDFTDDEFLELLAHFNNQRVKSDRERIVEKMATTHTLRPYSHRVDDTDQHHEFLELVRYRKPMRRAEISKQKSSLVSAIMKVVEKLRQYGPTTNRAIHYQLLNLAPWFNDAKQDERYSNTSKHYQNLNDILTRLRLTGELDWSAIGDPTRTTEIYDGFTDPAEFLKQQKRQLLAGYHRDLLQDQPHHVEVIIEKNTVFSYCEPICDQYKIPLTVAKGQSSIDCRFKIAKRYDQSGKDRLICLILSDFDADGEVIAGTLQNSLQDEFRLPVTCYKVGLNPAQIKRFSLHDNGIEAKATSTNYQWFADYFGDEQRAYELESMEPEQVQEVLIEVITTVLDMDAFNLQKERGEQDREKMILLQNKVCGFITETAGNIFDK